MKYMIDFYLEKWNKCWIEIIENKNNGVVYYVNKLLIS